MKEKKCTKCGETKKLSEFSKKKLGRLGLASTCKKCAAEVTADWRKKNPDKAKAHSKKWLKENKEYHREYSKSWYKENKEKAQKKNKAWRKNNPKKKQAIDNNRRARKNNASGKITSNEWASLVAATGNKCLRCEDENAKLTIDHVIPLVAGGSNSIDNAQPLCQKCNSSKGTKSTDYR